MTTIGSGRGGLPARLLNWLVGAPGKPAGLVEPAPGSSDPALSGSALSGSVRFGSGSSGPVLSGPTRARRGTSTVRRAASEAIQTLSEAWLRASLDAGWRGIGDWWHPACDSVLESLVLRRDPSTSIARLGRARAELGCTIEESIDDLVALWRVYARTEPSAETLRALAGGWAEAGLEPVGADTCIDPMTRLATRAYLEARLSELYRDARPGRPAELYTLVVVDIGQSAGLTNLADMCRVAEALRRCWNNGEPMARIAPGRAVALVTPTDGLSARLEELQDLLCGPGEPMCAAIWVEELPRTFGMVEGLLLDLAH